MLADAIEQLDRWGLTPEDAQRAGLYPVENVRDIFPDMPALPGIVIPYFGPDGLPRRYRDAQGADRPFARVRWLQPRQRPSTAFLKPGRGQRYDQPPRSGVAAYFPPLLKWAAIIADPAVPIVVTEGEAKALCAAKHGIPTIALGGVFSFMSRNQDGLLPELEAVNWRDRDVYLVFDSDAATNPQVMAAEGRLADELQRARHAKVRVVRLPPSEGGGKVGLDDFLKGRGLDAFNNLCRATAAVSALDVKILRLNTSIAWIEREGRIWDTIQKEWIPKANLVCGSVHSSVKHTTTGQRGSRTIIVAQEWLTSPLAQRFTEALFRPGEGRTVQGESGLALNMWDGFTKAEPGDIGPFLKLTRHIFSNVPNDVRDLCLNLLAYKAQNPQRKVPLSIVLVGLGGSGKSMWGEILLKAFEGYGRSISAAAMVDRFTGWTEKCLLAVVDEAEADVLAHHKERVRALISQMRIMMEEKHRPTREINCYTMFIFNSNKRAVGQYSHDDRRMIVIDCPERREDDFYTDIAAWKQGGGPGHLMHYFLNVDLKGWQPPATAPMTAEKAMAHIEGASPIEQVAQDIKLRGGEDMIMGWITTALSWATANESSTNPLYGAQARTMTQELPKMQIRPFYSPAELAMFFPMLMIRKSGQASHMPSAGEISVALREAGITYLKNADDPRGFEVRGTYLNFLIVAQLDKWRAPITQAQFEAAGPWPTYTDKLRERHARPFR